MLNSHNNSKKSKSNFDRMGLSEVILAILPKINFDYPTSVQEKTIPHILKGKDVLVNAITGSGKTAAFTLPIIDMLHSYPKQDKSLVVLILVPTRELAIQIQASFIQQSEGTNIKSMLMHGGVSKTKQLQEVISSNVLIATPGRLLEFLDLGEVDLSTIKYLIIDEVDKMLELGFVKDIQKITDQNPKNRQTMMFSATISKSIEKFAQEWLYRPVRINIGGLKITKTRFSEYLFKVPEGSKPYLLQYLLEDQEMDKVLIFVNMIAKANELVQELKKYDFDVEVIHSKKSQNTRNKVIRQFKSGELRLLIATDIASRGIHIDDITHVINYDIPLAPKIYVHRIGRTSRNTNVGIIYSFANEREIDLISQIESFTKNKINSTNHPYTENIEFKNQFRIKTKKRNKSKKKK